MGKIYLIKKNVDYLLTAHIDSDEAAISELQDRLGMVRVSYWQYLAHRLAYKVKTAIYGNS